MAISHAITLTSAHDMRCVANAFHVRADHVLFFFSHKVVPHANQKNTAGVWGGGFGEGQLCCDCRELYAWRRRHTPHAWRCNLRTLSSLTCTPASDMDSMSVDDAARWIVHRWVEWMVATVKMTSERMQDVVNSSEGVKQKMRY